MLFRALGLFACLFPIGWGLYSINVGDFGPMLGGAMFLIIGIVAALIIIGDGMEQNMNKKPEVLTQNFFNPHAYRLAHWVTKHPSINDPITVDNAWEYIRKWDAKHGKIAPHAPYSEAELKALNTPDPHLIHPDDLKRQASGHDDYPRRDIKV